MKINPKYILFFSFLLFALNGYAKGPSKEKIEQLETAKEQCLKDIQLVKEQVEEKENKKNELQYQLEERKQEAEKLQQEIDNTTTVIEYLNRVIDPTEFEFGKLSEELSELKNKMAELSTNFLFTPYEAYCIDVVANPDFQMGKGSLYYQQYSYRGDMLKHYKQDWEKVKEFLEANKYTTATDAGAVKEKLLKLPTYLQYAGGKINNGRSIPGYGEGWEQTYLGSIMSGLLKVLTHAEGKDATAKIISTFETYLNMMK